MSRRGNISIRTLLWPILSVLMLIGMVAEARTRIKRADAAPYQARCHDAIMSIPETIITANGIWSGSDTRVPDSAIQLLGNPSILSRNYVRQGAADIPISLLIVQCNDAHDLEGHYPLRCYPAQGDKLLSSGERTWHLPNQLDITGMEYEFALPDGPIGSEEVVYNFFITPYVPGKLVSHPELNGAICKDIEGVYKSGEDYQRRNFGAAEFQMLFNAQIPREARDSAFVDLLSSMQNVIQTLRNLDQSDPASGGK